METGSSVDVLCLTTAWYRNILSCFVYMELVIFLLLIMGLKTLFKNLNAFTFMTNAIVVISELLPSAPVSNQRGS